MFHLVIWDVDGDGNGGANFYLGHYECSKDKSYLLRRASRSIDNDYAVGAVVLDENLNTVKSMGMTDSEGAKQYIRTKVT